MWIILYNDIEEIVKNGSGWVDDYIVTDQFETPKIFETSSHADEYREEHEINGKCVEIRSLL